ncbi:MAG: hypothetical protein E7260_02230 [Lachnospiraceae bacterium]|nr:hypothetical protein [Lachnospiraceae bacterium]
MTSRNSFFKLLKEDFRRRLWVFILASVVFFGTFGVVFTMVLQQWVDNYTRQNGMVTDSFSYGAVYDIERLSEVRPLSEKVAGDVIEFIALNPWLVIVASVGALICGMSGFAFLHSKKQVDFYHSLPVKREMLFAVRFTNGVLFFLIPYVISLLYVFLLCGLFDAMSWKVLQGGLVGLVIHLMGFIIMYLFTILAVLLTGKLLMAFLGFAVFCFYAPAVYLLTEALKDVFFISLYGGSVGAMEDIIFSMKYVSPLSYYCSLFYSVYQAETMKTFWIELGCFVIFAAVLAVACLWLYKKRRSETSETAMSFKVSEPIIRILIAIPVGVLVGFMFFLIEQDYGDGSSAVLWMLFGCVLGAFLVHGFVESLFRGDIKKCLSHKWQLLATIGVAVVIPLCFYLDVFGYDSYLPNKSQVKGMAMYNSDLRFGGSYYEMKDGDSYYVNPQEYGLSASVEEFDAMYELAGILSEYTKTTRKNLFRFGRVRNYQYVPETEYGTYMTDFSIRYTLKNGKEVTRTYEYNYWAVLDLLEQIYNQEEYKKTTSPMYMAEDEGYRVKYVDCVSPLTEDAYRIRVNGQELQRIYVEELFAMSFDEVIQSAAIGRLEFLYEGDWYSYSAILYPQMTRTIAMLKECGYEVPLLTEAENIKELHINYTSEAIREAALDALKEAETYNEFAETLTEEGGISYKSTYEATAEYYEKYGEYTLRLTNPEEIAAILPHLMARSYSREFGPFPLHEENCQVSITFAYGEGEEQHEDVRWFYFLEDEIPEFVIRKMKENLHE